MFQAEIVAVHLVDFDARVRQRCHDLEGAEELFVCAAKTSANHCCVTLLLNDEKLAADAEIARYASRRMKRMFPPKYKTPHFQYSTGLPHRILRSTSDSARR